MKDIDKKPYLYDKALHNSEFDLSKLTGKKVAAITGHPSTELGSPTFKLYRIIFEDGTFLWAEGEHDHAYVTSNENTNNLDEETLQAFIDAE